MQQQNMQEHTGHTYHKCTLLHKKLLGVYCFAFPELRRLSEIIVRYCVRVYLGLSADSEFVLVQ